MSTNSCYQHILGIISSVFDAYSSVLFLPEGSGEAYSVAARFSLGDKIDPACTIMPGQGLVGWILRNQQPMLVNNFDQRQCFLGYYMQNEESKIKAFMGYPLGKGMGAICLDSKRQYSFSDKDQKILQLFGELIVDMKDSSCAIEEKASVSSYYNALQLLYELRKRVTRWKPFLAQFLAIVAETARFSHAYFCVLDEKAGTYFVEGQTRPFENAHAASELPLGAGLIGWVFKNGTPVITDSNASGSQVAPLFGKDAVTPQFHSVICLPMHVHKRTRGVLCLAHETPRKVSDEVRIFSQMAAGHLALFLENLYLRSQLHDLENELGQQRAAGSGAREPSDTTTSGDI
jgi:transcriptional regulator with GAF, ATPase, and Fis domain